ncbi:MAG: DUF6597 domain-containing transcriptional factor [Streptosporangiaceae bacterium]
MRPATEDSRGILRPEEGLRRFSLHRYPPCAPLGRLIHWYWTVRWDLRGRPPHEQHVLTHPCVNVVFEPDRAAVYGVARRVSSQRLEGRGWALGVMFRPGGFSPFLAGPVSSITDAVSPVGAVFGDGVRALADSVRATDDEARRVALVDEFLAGRVPARTPGADAAVAAAEIVATDRTVLRVEDLAGRSGWSVRQLQRLFRVHVGASPKWVIRRYRLLEAAERVARGEHVGWESVAADLGYADQPHLVRDFTAAIGMSPARYAAACRSPANA